MQQTGFVKLVHKVSRNGKDYVLVHLDNKIFGGAWKGESEGLKDGDYVNVVYVLSDDGKFNNISAMTNVPVPEGVKPPAVTQPPIPTKGGNSFGEKTYRTPSPQAVRMSSFLGTVKLVSQYYVHADKKSTPKSQLTLTLGLAQEAEAYIQNGTIDKSEVEEVKSD